MKNADQVKTRAMAVDALAEQLAFYFGDANLRASQYFAERLGPDRRGWYLRAAYREISKLSDIPRRIESSKTSEMF